MYILHICVITYITHVAQIFLQLWKKKFSPRKVKKRVIDGKTKWTKIAQSEEKLSLGGGEEEGKVLGINKGAEGRCNFLSVGVARGPGGTSGYKAGTGNGVKPSWYCVKIYIIAGSNSCCVRRRCKRRAQTRTVSRNILSPFISIVYSHRSSHEFRKAVSPSPSSPVLLLSLLRFSPSLFVAHSAALHDQTTTTTTTVR